MTASGNLFIVSAPSGGGKTSLTRALIPVLEARGIEAMISVSYTTRAPRHGEQDGVHYRFVDDARFLDMIAAGEFLEQAHVFGRRYGTGRERTTALLAQGIDVILDIDWQGARQVREQLPLAESIFILPPSLAALERRLRDRSQDDDATIAGRMREAQNEMSHYGEYDYLVVNDEFEPALAELAAIFCAARARLAPQKGRQQALIDALLAK
ncbi:MAG: guanylate kinase [Pseudomonadota bacterium]|nr:guanylate kinase [Pseudomonadota bacterium]